MKKNENPMFKKLNQHVGHAVEVVGYGVNGQNQNISIECLDCNEVLYDVEKEEDSLTKSIKKVLEYLWGDEQRHFEEEGGNSRKQHIFTHLKTIRDEMGLASDEFPDEE